MTTSDGSSTESDQVEVRKNKRQRLVDAHIDIYPHAFKPTHSIDAIRRDFEALEVARTDVRVASRVRVPPRTHGQLHFIDLAPGRDDDKIQIMVERSKLSPDEQLQLDALDAGDWLGVTGFCQRTRRGEPSVAAKTLNILCKSIRPLPNFKGKTVQDDELLSRKPELEMMFGRKRQVLRQRAAAIGAVRNLLAARGVTEVETPFLNPYFGGAEARPFTTRVWALDDEEVFLAISPEIEDKRLIVGGFTEGVFTFARNFRNEGLDATHNPEFSALEVYIPFHDVFDMIDLTEAIFSAACVAIHGETRCRWQDIELDFTPPWPRIEMLRAVHEATGLDVATMSKSALARACHERGLDRTIVLATTGAQALADRIRFAGLSTARPLGEMSGNELRALIQTHKLHTPMELEDTEWDFLVTGLFERFVEPTLARPCHVILHPEKTTVLCKTVRGGETLPNGQRLIERCESYAAGMELTNAYTELNDPIHQRDLVLKQAQARSGGEETAMPMNGLFIEAIEMGMPPTGGLGVGIDRMIMLLTDSRKIREVIAFPLVRR